MMKLSKTQEEIVNRINGAILVNAGPGSGKTTVLVERIKHLLLVKKRSKVLALTFSNYAAETMRNRLQEDNSIGELINNVTIGTIHSFCLEVVETRGNLIGLGKNIVIFENISDKQAVLKDVFFSNPRLYKFLKEEENQNEYLHKCLTFIEYQKKNLISPDLCEGEEPFKTIYREYNQSLYKQNALDFDDVLLYAYRIFTENPSVANLYTSVYKFICIDEAQDLNFAQYSIIKAMCGENYKNIMLVGDENQSIYGFNGSDSTFMTKKFVTDFSPDIYRLSDNFRSAKSIVQFANLLGDYESTTDYVYDGELSAFSFENEDKEASFISQKIEKILEQGHSDIQDDLDYDSFAVIARNKYLLKNIEEQFIKQDIPFYYKKTTSGIENESDDMKVFELGMRLIINSKDIVHLKKLYKIIGSSKKQSISLGEGYENLIEVLKHTKFEYLSSAFYLLSNDRLEFSKVLDQIEKNISITCSDDEKYLIINDIKQWRQHWRKYTSIIPRESRSLMSFRNYISLGKTQSNVSNKGISLLTAHMSKGLQYDVVFIIGLSEGTFPDYRAINSGIEQLEQEKNNMYVAVTRAKRLCYLSYSRSKKMPWGNFKLQRPSRFLKGITIEKL